jgi:hypothetical protein
MPDRVPESGPGLQRRPPTPVPSHAEPDSAAIIRRLRAEPRRAKEDIEQIQAQLGHANLPIVELRKKIATKLSPAPTPREAGRPSPEVEL